MPPDFSKKTVDTLAKRAAFKCSNPDCRVSTVGPNSDEKKSTVIGEAAHIYGARQNSKRYNSNMSDAARAEITNSIWLCRNCHKLIDTDEQKYTSNILFAWREQHEEYIQSELGSVTDRIQLEEQTAELSLFQNYPPVARRIVIDKPEGWEFRLAAELMRYLNRPLFRRIEDLREGLYLKPQVHINDEDVLSWIQKRIAERSNLIPPAVGLLDKLTESFGPPGKPGNAEEIHHTACLIRDYLEQIVQYEEEICFANVPQKYEKLVSLLKNLIGSQASKLEEIPNTLDEVVSLIGTDHGGTVENPHIVNKTITFELPDNWEKQMTREFKRASGSTGANGCLTLGIGAFVVWVLSLFL